MAMKPVCACSSRRGWRCWMTATGAACAQKSGGIFGCTPLIRRRGQSRDAPLPEGHPGVLEPAIGHYERRLAGAPGVAGCVEVKISERANRPAPRYAVMEFDLDAESSETFDGHFGGTRPVLRCGACGRRAASSISPSVPLPPAAGGPWPHPVCREALGYPPPPPTRRRRHSGLTVAPSIGRQSTWRTRFRRLS